MVAKPVPFKSEERFMCNKTDEDVETDQFPTTLFYETTKHRTRNFAKALYKYFNISPNTTTSICTPLFVPRTRKAARKKVRLKSIMNLTTEKADVFSTSEEVLTDRGKFRKLLFPKHLSTHSPAKQVTESMDTTRKVKQNITNILNSGSATNSLTEESTDLGAHTVTNGNTFTSDTMTTVHTNVLSTNKEMLKDRGKIRKLLFPKHFSTVSSARNITESINRPRKKKQNVTTTLHYGSETNSLAKESTYLYSHAFTNVSTFTLYPSTMKLKVIKSKERSNLSRGTADVCITLHPVPSFTTQPRQPLKTQELQTVEPTQQLNFTNKTTIPPRYTRYMPNVRHKSFHLKNIFHVPSSMNRKQQNTSSTKYYSSGKSVPLWVSGHLSTSVGVLLQNNTPTPSLNVTQNSHKNHTCRKISENRTEIVNVTVNSFLSTSKPRNTFQFANLFHKIKHLKYFSSNTSTRRPNNLGSANFSLSTGMINSTSTATNNLSFSTAKIDHVKNVKNVSRYIPSHILKMFRKNHTTKLSNTSLTEVVDNSSLWNNVTLKSHYNESTFGSESIFSLSTTMDALKNVSESQNIFSTQIFTDQKQSTEKKNASYRIKTTRRKGPKCFRYSTVNTTMGPNSSLYHALEDKKETKKVTRNPFKVKYLLKFRNTLSATKNAMSSTKTYFTEPINEKLATSEAHGYEEVNQSIEGSLAYEITTKPMNFKNNLRSDTTYASGQMNNGSKHKQNKIRHNLTTEGIQDAVITKCQSTDDLQTFSSDDYSTYAPTRLFEETANTSKSTEFGVKFQGTWKNQKHGYKKLANHEIDSIKSEWKGNLNETINLNESKIGKLTNLLFKKPTRHDKNKIKCTYRWCKLPTVNVSITVTDNTPLNVTLRTPAKSRATRKPVRQGSSTMSSFSESKKAKYFFHFKTTQTSKLPTNGTTTEATPYNMTNELKNNSNLKPTVVNKVSIRFSRKNKTLHRSYLHPRPTENADTTTILDKDYSDYTETIVMKKHKKHPNRTVLQNVADVNDTSFNVMAYVMKPLDSLVSVFKALSPNSVTKIGDVNATDIKNGSFPDHLQPMNSSIVVLAVNNTNASSKDIHESKLEMALDLLGGMYNCMFNNFEEAKPEDIHFYLYTRNNPEEPEKLSLPQDPSLENVTCEKSVEPILDEELTSEMPDRKRAIEYEEDDYEDESEAFEPLDAAKSEVQSKWFNVRAETKILIHGYLQDYQTDIMVSMKDAFLARGDYNVLVLDWSVLVDESSCYPMVALHGLRQVGALLARLIARLVEAGVSLNKIHIVGFSLGAHVAGHAGTFIEHGLVGRITGLDPALPYVPMEPDTSLDTGDAVFVDIIHSAAGLLGQSGPMGHVDFYPNGGSQQPGCEVSSLSCSHRRAALYFIESINSEIGFPAVRCESWHHFQTENCSSAVTVLMGNPCPSNASGKYYLVTGYKSPFALQPDEHFQVKKSLLLDLFYDSGDL